MAKKHIHTLLLAVLTITTLCLISCGHKDSITIKGQLQNGAGKNIYIEEMSPESRIFIDSIHLDSKGRFKFQYDMPYKTFFNLHVSENDYVVLLPDFGETIEISGDYDALSLTYHLQGSPESQLLWQLQDYSNQGSKTLKDIVATDQKNKELLNNGELTEAEFATEHAITDSIYLSTFSDQQKYVVDFIQNNLGSLSTLIALYKPFNNRALINPEDSFEFYEAVLEGLQESMPDNPHTLSFKNQVMRTGFLYANQK